MGHASPDARRRILVVTLLLLLPFSLIPTLKGQIDGCLIDLRSLPPLVDSATGNGLGEEVSSGSEGRVRVVLELEEDAGPPERMLKKIDAAVEAVYGGMVQAEVPGEALLALSGMKGIKSFRKPHPPILLDVVGEGVSAIGADLVHGEGVLGEGVRVAVVDVGFDLSNPEVSSNVAEALSFRSDGDITGGSEANRRHGTGVAEIIVDVAPKAQLYLYNFGTDVEFLLAMDHAVTVGVDVISLSIGFVNVGPLDGSNFIDEAVDRAWDHGVTVFTAAGNEAGEHWSGVFIDEDGDGINEYAPGDETNEIQVEAGSFVQVFLNWDDWPNSDQDYNLFIFNGAMSLAAISANLQTGGQPPAEGVVFYSPVPDTYRIVVGGSGVRGDARFHLYSFGHELEHSTPAGSLTSPGDARGTITVGATSLEDDLIEPFSSRGPTDDGRIKPDLTAPDGVSTTSFPGEPFHGTSASTPHAAGVAALVKGLDPSLTPEDIRRLLEGTAKDLGDPGKDALYGAGRVDAYAAFLQASPGLALFTLDVHASSEAFQYPNLPPHDPGVRVSVNYSRDGVPHSDLLTTPFQVEADQDSIITLTSSTLPQGYEWVEWDNYGFGRASNQTIEVVMEGDRVAIAYLQGIPGALPQVTLTVHAHPDTHQFPSEPPIELNATVKATYQVNGTCRVGETLLIGPKPLPLGVDLGSWVQLEASNPPASLTWLEWDEYGSGRTSNTTLKVHMDRDKTAIAYYTLPPLEKGDFTLTATPTSQTFLPGQTLTYTITITPIEGFTGEISLTLSDPPPNTTVTLNPPTLQPTGTVTLILETTPNTPPGHYTLTLTATGEGITHTLHLTLTPLIIPGFPALTLLTGILLASLLLLRTRTTPQKRRKSVLPPSREKPLHKKH